jgi:hypothetical protein
MNRFRTKKHKKGGDVLDDAASEVTIAPSIRKFKKNKKNLLPEPVPQIDISTALPDNNDFRTSLLMPNLSARFSMLREQDDPKTKIGKANDDSVLFPKRASRLNVFGHNPLTNVPEVVSLRGVIRPPFAFGSRTASYASEAGYDSEDGPMSPGGSMSRSRPGEGNTMFGGRQKIYQIPIAASSSVRNFSSPEPANAESTTALGGRARYENDVTLSAFKDDTEERRRREDEASEWPDYSQYNDASSPASNMTGVNRGTSSSTAASNKRDSTAATSVASQTAAPSRTFESHVIPQTSVPASKEAGPAEADLDRTATINKRLYGKTFDQPSVQPSRKISNPEPFQRQRAASNANPPTKSLSQSKSAHNLYERFNRGTPVYASSSFRTASPPPSATPPGFSPIDSTISEAKPNASTGYGYVPPLSPPISETEDVATYNNAVQPEDRGKATALGLFNKPQQYDESQFSQRQRQLHQGRESPSVSEDAPVAQARSQTPSESNFRSRADSAVSQHAATFTERRLGSQRDEFPLRKITAPHPLNTGTGGTFLGNISADSDDDDVSPIVPRSTTPLRMRRPSGKAHPFRSTPTPEPEERPSSRQTNSKTGMYSDHISEEQPDHLELETVKEQNELDPMDEEPVILPSPIAPSVDDSDSPTLGPGAGLGLSGLIRSHLRQDSDQSSIHTPPSPRHAPKLSMDQNPPSSLAPLNTRTTNPPESMHSNPWEFDDYYGNNEQPKADSNAHQIPTAPYMKSRARQMLEQAQALKEQETKRKERFPGQPAPRPSQDSGFGRPSMDTGKAQRTLGDEAPRVRHEPVMTKPWQEHAKIPRLLGQDAPPPLKDHPMNRNWQDETKTKHSRGASTETQRERDDFEKELEERKKKVQESLKTHAEGQSRSASPVAGLFENPMKPGNAFAMLKPKSSRGSLREPTGPPQQSKAMKMLGLGAATMSSREPPRPAQENNMWKEEEEEMLRSFGKARKAPSPRADKQIRPVEPKPPSRGPRESIDEPRDNSRRPSSPPSSKSSRRDRSSSDMSSGRSKSRQGRYKDDLDKAMFEGTGSTTSAYVSDDFRPAKVSVPPRPSMDTFLEESPVERSESALSGRFRSNSRAAGAIGGAGPSGYFDSKPLLPIQTNAPPKQGFMGLPPRPSPRTPYSAHSAHSTPPLFETSPAGTPTSLRPPQGPGTPQQSAFPTTHSSKSLASRKRSVNKNLISEPTLLSSTSSVNTVGLPPGASLSNGSDPSPLKSQFSPTMPNIPVPPINPRRRRGTTTQTILGAFSRSDKHDTVAQPPLSAMYPPNLVPGREFSSFGRDEQSTFSDEGEKRPKQTRQRLRKSSSEGGSLNAKARQHAYMAPSPAVPRFPKGVQMEGGMF